MPVSCDSFCLAGSDRPGTGRAQRLRRRQASRRDRGHRGADAPGPLAAPARGQGSVPAAAVTDPRRRAYISKTDRICRAVDPERNTVREQVGASADTQEAAKSYEKETALGTSELKRLEAVPAPPGDAKLLQANVFGPVRHQLALRAKIRVALAAADVSRLRALRAELDNISRALSGFARGYGWRACGEG